MPSRRTTPATATGTLRRRARRVLIGLAGATLTLVGLVLLVAPGPGWLIVFAGLTVLATEFEWAQRLKERPTARVRRVRAATRHRVPARCVAACAGLAVTAALAVALACGLEPGELLSPVTEHVSPRDGQTVWRDHPGG